MEEILDDLKAGRTPKAGPRYDCWTFPHLNPDLCLHLNMTEYYPRVVLDLNCLLSEMVREEDSHANQLVGSHL